MTDAVPDAIALTLHVNGRAITRTVALDLALVDFLQEDLGLTGTKLCCGIGACRVCTVAVRETADAPAQPTLACLTPAASLAGQFVETIESMAGAEGPSSVQRAFLEHFAFQCGYCAPGFVMATTMLLEQARLSPIPRPRLDEAIQDALGDHICRCTGYARYHAAARALLLADAGSVIEG